MIASGLSCVMQRRLERGDLYKAKTHLPAAKLRSCLYELRGVSHETSFLESLRTVDYTAGGLLTPRLRLQWSLQ